MIDNEISNPEETSGIELSDDIDNQYVKRLLNNKIIKFFSQNTSPKIAIVTALITIGSFFIKVLGYMRLKGYLSIFSISIDSVGYSSNHGFIEFLINAVTFIGLAIAVAMTDIVIEFLIRQYQLRKITYSITKATFFQKVKRFFSDIKESFLLLLATLFFTELINILLSIYMASGRPFFTFTIIEWFAVLLMLTVIEIITAALILFIRSIKNRKQRKKKKPAATETERELEGIKKKVMPVQKSPLIDIITSSVVLLFFLYSTSAYLSGALSAQQKKSFPIIEGRYAVVHQDQQHYWVIASQEKNVDSLLLNTTSQKILDIHDIELTIKSYKEVVIQYK